MPYRVFLVEDEITTREGIRDNVDWRSSGFELCGEASDGEIALPQIEAAQPDVLITDIKMPFMDGLQLCRIIREHMPWMKIIIISGHSDFQYAQTAIQLGVSEYLLKPVSVQDMQAILARVALALDQEKSERAYLKKLRSQVEDNLNLLREKFLLRLVTGGESSLSAIEQAQQLGLNILAPYYAVILFEASALDGSGLVDYNTFQRAGELIAGLLSNNQDVLLTRKDVQEFVLILKGDSREQIEQDRLFLAGLIKEEIEKKAGCRVAVGSGPPQQRLGDLHRSYGSAWLDLKQASDELEPADLDQLEPAALRAYLECGRPEEFDAFFDQHMRLLAGAGLHSRLLRHYLIVNSGLAAAQFVSDLGGDSSPIIAGIDEDHLSARLQTVDQIRAEIWRVFSGALRLRDSQGEVDRKTIIARARQYISDHYSDANLSLNDAAAQVNFSPNHFSAVFRSETGVTFRDFLTQTRIEGAKKMLRTTRLKCAEVAFRCGYNDPHYFSLIFRKNCGMTPQQYRAAQRGQD